ncbi:MAG: hypothetical protein IKM46_01985 [Clostridia bacterium]|nr:hypothetical protein [Clostridia bacterium]
MKEILKIVPKTLYVIITVLVISGILTTSFGIYSMARKSSDSPKSTVDIKGEIVAINNNGKNITVKYPYGDQIYTVILDHYEGGMQVGDSVDLKVNPNEFSSVFTTWSLLVTLIGIAVIVSALCVILHTFVLLKSSRVSPGLSNYAWIVSVMLSFVSCGLGIALSLTEKSSAGIALALAGGAVFTLGAWFLYVFGNRKVSRRKQAKSLKKQAGRE